MTGYPYRLLREEKGNMFFPPALFIILLLLLLLLLLLKILKGFFQLHLPSRDDTGVPFLAVPSQGKVHLQPEERFREFQALEFSWALTLSA